MSTVIGKAMDFFAESMEVIRLRTPEGRYLTADEDRVSVALSKPQMCPFQKILSGSGVVRGRKCCLKSIYEKVLAAGQCLLFIQESCPVSNGACDWFLQNMNIDDKEFQAKLKHVNDSRYLETTDNGVYLGSTDNVRSKIWTVEIVKSNNNSEQKKNHEQHLLQRAIREGELFFEQWQRERQWKEKQQLQQKWKQDQQRQQQYFVAGPPKSMMCGYDKLATPQLKPYTSACMSQSNWPVQQLDHAEQLLNHEQESKKSNSTNNSNTPPPLPPTTTTTAATTPTITARKEVAVVTTPISNNGGHHQLIQLTGCQVGQVVLTFTPGVGGGYSHFNSGPMLMDPAHRLMAMCTAYCNW